MSFCVLFFVFYSLSDQINPIFDKTVLTNFVSSGMMIPIMGFLLFFSNDPVQIFRFAFSLLCLLVQIYIICSQGDQLRIAVSLSVIKDTVAFWISLSRKSLFFLELCVRWYLFNHVVQPHYTFQKKFTYYDDQKSTNAGTLHLQVWCGFKTIICFGKFKYFSVFDSTTAKTDTFLWSWCY